MALFLNRGLIRQKFALVTSIYYRKILILTITWNTYNELCFPFNKDLKSDIILELINFERDVFKIPNIFVFKVWHRSKREKHLIKLIN